MQTYRLPLLTPEAVGVWRQQLSECSFIDGKLSATGRARDAKNNAQVTHDEAGQRLLNGLGDMLMQNKMLQFAAMPKRLGGLMVNRYGVGQTYGWHVDNSLMRDGQGPLRTDLSFTLGLTDPTDYDGGELELYINDTLTSVRPKLGEIFVYPTGNLHRVTPLTRGQRVSFVGWIESWVQDHDLRTSLTKLRMLTVELQNNKAVDEALVLRHLEVYHALVRRCAV